MDRQAAIDRLLDHYEHPRNQGPLDRADVVQPGGQPDCGDQVTIYLRVDPAQAQIERITRYGFDARIELVTADGSELLVQGTRERLDELELASGQIVWVASLSERTFA